MRDYCLKYSEEESAAGMLLTTDSLRKTTRRNLPIPVTLTSSAEIDRPTYGSSALQRAGIQLSTDVQVTHLRHEAKVLQSAHSTTYIC